MSRLRAYILPFNEDGTYSTEEVEITADVDLKSISAVKQQIDQDQYKLGVLTFNDLNLKLKNDTGKYSPPEVTGSIFRKIRNGSLFKLRWEIQDEPSYCGLAVAGSSKLSPLVEIYEGFINDDATRENVKTEYTSLKVLSIESVITKVDVPFASLTGSDTLRDILFKILDQAKITELITVDLSNITLATNLVPDDLASLDSYTGKEAIDELLLLGNSILYIKDRVLYVSPRTISVEKKFEFYGPASTDGLENIQTLSDIYTGLSKVKNFLTWSGETFNVQDNSSVADYGPRKREIASKLITDTGKQTTILANIVSEFGSPKPYFRLNTPMTYAALNLFFLDKVNVDYPTIYVAAEGEDIPLYNVSFYDEGVYPIPQSALTIDKNTDYKIMGVNLLPLKQLIEFELRES